MPERKPMLPHAKSYTSVYDIFGAMSYSNVFHRSTNQEKKEHSVFHTICGDTAKQSLDYDSPVSKSTNYVTSEKYNSLIYDCSRKIIAASTSTIFYDLDDIAKRHSFHCLTEISISNANFMKVMRMPTNPNGFGAKSTAIVQECATQIHPKLVPRDSIEINSKKVKKKLSKDAVLSSEIFLRDDDYLHDFQKNYNYSDIPDRQQKFWSYAKYRTEYTKPIPEEKKSKKKDKGKRTEDPCPCQLFSYACPCTDKKSLTELAKKSKSQTVADQVTSTMKVLVEERDTKACKSKKHREPVKEDKPTNTSIVEMVEVIVPKNEPVMTIAKQDVPILTDQNNVNKTNKNKSKSRKKSRRILCPNCKEKVDVVISISTTEEEESLKCEHSSIYRSKEMPSTAAYAYRASPNSLRSKGMEDGDLCLHEPRCELLPVCQILPTDNNYYNVNHKCMKKHSVPKSTPRIIRITKACRHHPPCTVVPSCQRANVLKNNCEFIPPCLHRPRCVNLPLCVPFSKNLHYDEGSSKVIDDIDTSDCPHIPRCKYVPVCQHESVTNNMDHQINMVSRVQNACEFLTDYNTPAFLVNPKSTCVANSFSPCKLSSNPCYATDPHNICRSNKSCQFDSSHCKCNESKEGPSNETVIFIRDVGCQFRNKNYSPKDSVLQSKASSNSFDFVDVKMGNYYTNVHTLRYEDKYTSPLSGEEASFSTGSITSIDLDSECPSHGRRANNRCSPRTRPTTGFIPKSAYVAAYSSLTDPMTPKYHNINKSDIKERRDSRSAFPIKSRRSFLKGKYRKMFSVKRRRKSKISSHVLNHGLKGPLYEQHII